MIVLEIIDLALLALLITLRLGLWVCLAYAWQPWAVSRPTRNDVEKIEGSQS